MISVTGKRSILAFNGLYLILKQRGETNAKRKTEKETSRGHRRNR